MADSKPRNSRVDMREATRIASRRGGLDATLRWAESAPTCDLQVCVLRIHELVKSRRAEDLLLGIEV